MLNFRFIPIYSLVIAAAIALLHPSVSPPLLVQGWLRSAERHTSLYMREMYANKNVSVFQHIENFARQDGSRIIVWSQQRTYSTLLCTKLADLMGVVPLNFKPRIKDPNQYFELWPENSCEDYCDYLLHHRIVKMMDHRFWPRATCLLPCLDDLTRSKKFLHVILYRKNHFMQDVSLLRARKTGKWLGAQQPRGNSLLDMKVSPDDLTRFIREKELYYETLWSFFEDRRDTWDAVLITSSEIMEGFE